MDFTSTPKHMIRPHGSQSAGAQLDIRTSLTYFGALLGIVSAAATADARSRESA